MIEQEFKAMLSQTQFEPIKAKLRETGEAKETIQINYYYDTQDLLLYKRDNTLRVRQKNGKLQLQHKYDRSEAGSFRICKEYEQPMSSLPKTIDAQAFPNDYGPNQPFLCIGNLVTVRTDFDICGALVSLDENFYLGRTDYELEIEADDGQSLESILEIIGLELQFNHTGKYKRFINAYKTWGSYAEI